MLRHTYTSDPVQYEPEPEGYVPPDIHYNDWLITAPRHFLETLYSGFGLAGLYVTRANDIAEPEVNAQVRLTTVEYPSWGSALHVFDGATGEWLRRESRDWGIYYEYLSAAGDGSLWGRTHFHTYDHVDAVSGALIATYPAEHFSTYPSLPEVFCVDIARNVLVGAKTNEAAIGVWRLSDGELLRTVSTAGSPIDVFREDDRRAYAVSAQGVVTVIDYVAGNVLGCVGMGRTFAGVARFAWDPYRRRILVIEQVADAADGACQTQIDGYYPASLAVSMSAPIPLAKPRKGRTVPVVVELRGDSGELITGAEVRQTPSGDGIVTPVRRATDGAGLARFSLACDAAGSQTLDAEATV